MPNYDDTVEMVEEFLEEQVTSTPLSLSYTAADFAEYADVEVYEASRALQDYRHICTGATKATAAYSIGTYERGPHARWLIFTWPGMTNTQQEYATTIFIGHEILSTLREEVKPMIKNVYSQTIPAIQGNRGNRSMLRTWIAKIEAYITMLQGYRRNIAGVRPVALRAVTGPLDALVVSRIDQLEALQAILTGL